MAEPRAEAECRPCVWMGSVPPYMTGDCILNAFRSMGKNAIDVLLFGRGACLVSFESHREAMEALHKLNYKPIPGTCPVEKFYLKACNSGGSKRLFTILVGNLTCDVDDYSLYQLFASKYKSVRYAEGRLQQISMIFKEENIGRIQNLCQNVDEIGPISNTAIKKREECFEEDLRTGCLTMQKRLFYLFRDEYDVIETCGFVHFGSEEEVTDSLVKMNGYVGLGKKHLIVLYGSRNELKSQYFGIIERQKKQELEQQMYSLYQLGCNGYCEYHRIEQDSSKDSSLSDSSNLKAKTIDGPDVIEHTVQLDVDQLNIEKINADCHLWDAIESSKWLPMEALEVT